MLDAEARVQRSEITDEPFRLHGQSSYMVYTQLKSTSHLCASHSLEFDAQNVASSSEC